MITGESLRPDLLLLTKDKLLYILELTRGFETNIQNNSNRKAAKYSSLLSELSHLIVKLHLSTYLWVLLELWVLLVLLSSPYSMN